MRVKIWLIGVVFLCLCGCNQVGVDQKELRIFRQNLSTFKNNCDKMARQVEELTHITADLRLQVKELRESRSALVTKPVPTSEGMAVRPPHADKGRERNESRRCAKSLKPTLRV